MIGREDNTYLTNVVRNLSSLNILVDILGDIFGKIRSIFILELSAKISKFAQKNITKV